MNRINPIYVGALLLIIVGFMLLNLSSAKDEYAEAKVSYKETLIIANELSGLKAVYADKKKIKKSLQKILNSSVLKESKIEQQSKKSGTTLSSKAMNMTAVNYLMGKLLNGTYQIKSMKIKRLSETKVTLDMEIKW